MSTTYRYVLPVEQTEWKFDGNTETCFTWEYDEPREALLQLYAKGKKQQWDAAERIDWSLDLDPENPMMLDDRVVHIYGTDLWNRMNEQGAPAGSPSFAGFADLAIHARRAGRADRNGQDRADRAGSRLEILRRDS